MPRALNPEPALEISLLTVPELAALLRVPRSWVHERTRERGPDAIPCYKAGKRYLFDRGEVLEWFRLRYRRENAPSPRLRLQRGSAR